LPNLLPIAILHAIEELTSVNGSVAESQWAVSLPLVAVYHVLGDPVPYDGTALVDVIELEHHSLTVVHSIHDLFLHLRPFIVTELDAPVLGCQVRKPFISIWLVIVIWVPVVHVLVFVKCPFYVFLSVLRFLVMLFAVVTALVSA
jgi:hypothetical protein